MSDPNDPTIRSIPILRSIDPVTAPGRSNRQNWGYRLMLTTITLGTIGGFGAWHFYGGRISSEGIDSIEEVDGFELSTPFVAVPSREESPNVELGSSAPMSVPDSGDDEIASNQPLNSNNAPSAKVWLTGTIEEEVSEQIELPAQISGGTSDSNVFR